jgi:hypothetical protein
VILDVVVSIGHARMENVRILGIQMLDTCFLKVKLLEPVYAKGSPHVAFMCWNHHVFAANPPMDLQNRYRKA